MPTPTHGTRPAPTPAVHLVAAIDIYGSDYWQGAMVVFQVTDTGSAATRELTASITLPPGSSLGGDEHHGHDRGGWDCQPNSSGAICQHDGISAGSQVQGAIYIGLTDSAACGQPVQVVVSSGSASANAQPPEDLHCLGRGGQQHTANRQAADPAGA